MKRIILLHTVQCMYLTFEERLRKELNQEVKIDNLLDTFFVSGEKYCAEKLCERHFKERSQIYRDRKKAIKRFSLAVFGNMETEDLWGA